MQTHDGIMCNYAAKITKELKLLLVMKSLANLIHFIPYGLSYVFKLLYHKRASVPPQKTHIVRL